MKPRNSSRKVFLTVVDGEGKQVWYQKLMVYLGDGKTASFSADIDGLIHGSSNADLGGRPQTISHGTARGQLCPLCGGAGGLTEGSVPPKPARWPILSVA